MIQDLIIHKIDPLTGEEFSTSKQNQKFANAKNRVRYNNHLAHKKRLSLQKWNNPINANLKALDRIMFGVNQKTVSVDFLIGAGIHLGYFTNSFKADGIIYQCIYHYALTQNKENLYVIKRSK